jgi:hypothetical protein
VKVDIYRLGEADDTWAVFVEGCQIEDLTGLTRERAEHHASLIVASHLPGAGVVPLADSEPADRSLPRWHDSGSGPGWSGDWGQHDDPEQQP